MPNFSKTGSRNSCMAETCANDFSYPITLGMSSCVAVVVYRPGSSAVTCAFFTERADLLGRLSTSDDALVLDIDITIRLERVTDPMTVKFLDLIAGYGLTQHVLCATHDAGGPLDVVCTWSHLATPTVDSRRRSVRPKHAAVDNVITPSVAGLHHVNTSSLAIIQPRPVPDRPASIRSM